MKIVDCLFHARDEWSTVSGHMTLMHGHMTLYNASVWSEKGNGHKQEYIIEEERGYRTLIFKMLSRPRASSIAHALVRVKFILHICVDGHVTLHSEFQRGILRVHTTLSLLLYYIYSN